MRNIEDTIFDDMLPVNSLAMIERLREVLDERGTNCLSNIRDDLRVRKLMWLLNSQVYGQSHIIDMEDEWFSMHMKEGSR